MNKVNKNSKSRWKRSCEGKLYINNIEGKVRINNIEVRFSSINYVSIVMNSSIRVESNLTTIPVCLHLGVLVNIDGRNHEIILISKEKKRSGIEFHSMESLANRIVKKLNKLSNTPVPKGIHNVKDDSRIKLYDRNIEKKKIELKKLKTSKPEFTLPTKFRNPDLNAMSDKEYLSYFELGDKHGMTKLRIQEGTVYKIVFWFLSVMCLLFCLTSLSSSGVIISEIIFATTGFLINPMLYNYLSTKNIKIPKGVCILIFIIGFVAGTMTY